MAPQASVIPFTFIRQHLVTKGLYISLSLHTQGPHPDSYIMQTSSIDPPASIVVNEF